MIRFRRTIGGLAVAYALLNIPVTVDAATDGTGSPEQSNGAIAGRVTNASTGAGVANVTVQIFNNAGSMVTSAPTGATGDYVTTALSSGTYFARTSGSVGFLDELYDNIPCELFCTATTGTPISVAAGATTSNINFALNVGGRIAGTVTNAATGAPLASVSVEIYTTGGTDLGGVGTNGAGNFASFDLPTGTYRARTLNGQGFIDEVYENIPCDPGCYLNQATPVSVTAGATTTVDFALDIGGRIAGRVTNAATGAPIANLRGTVYNTSGVGLGISTNASGDYLTGRGLPAGTYFVQTGGPSQPPSGFIDELYDNIPCVPSCDATFGNPIAVAVGATTNNINFGLDPGGIIAGRVTNAATGAALANVAVQIYNASGSLVTSISTNATGDYTTLRGLPTGTYFARTFNSQGFIDELYDNLACVNCAVTAGTPISVAAGAAGATTGNVNFALAVGGRVAGSVTNAATGGPLANISVQIYNSSGSFVTSGSTNASGAYMSGAGLPTGTYFARTSNTQGFIDELYNDIPCAGCNVTTGTPISVAAGAAGATTSNIDFALALGGRVAGRVTNRANGAVVSAIGVEIYNAAGSFVAGVATNSAGAYTTLVGLPTGTYFAKTSNSLGFVDRLYNDIVCAGCNVTTGAPISVTANATTTGIDFALDTGGRIAGRVTNAATGAPFSNVSVEIYNASGSFVTRRTTDGTGIYMTLTGLPPGNYFARTFNPIGFQDLLYNNIPCNSCTVTTGTAIAVAGANTTGNINFALSPPVISTAAPYIIAGLTALPHSGGWMAVRRNLPNNLDAEVWLRVPWDAYNANGGGVHAAAGNLDADAFDEIVVGLTTGGVGWIAILDDGQHGYALLGWAQVPWTSYHTANGEVYPAVGDIDGDGLGEIVAGLGPGGAGWFAIFQGADANFAFASWQRVNWTAYNTAQDGSTHPAVADVDNDGAADIVLGLGRDSHGYLEIKNGATAGFSTKTWIQTSWPTYNQQNGTTYPAAHGQMIAIGLGAGSAGWLEIRGGGSTNYAHARWVQVSWPAYNSANGETHPALANLDAVAGPELVVGLSGFAPNGGWFEVINPATGASLGWRNVGWGAFTNAGGGLWPAIGKLK